MSEGDVVFIPGQPMSEDNETGETKEQEFDADGNPIIKEEQTEKEPE